MKTRHLDRTHRKILNSANLVFLPGLHIEDEHEESEASLLHVLREEYTDLVVRVCHAAEHNKPQPHDLVAPFLKEMHTADIAVVMIHQRLSSGQSMALTVALIEMMPIVLIKDSTSNQHVPQLVEDFLSSTGQRSLILLGKSGDEEGLANQIHRFCTGMIERTAV